MKKKIITIGGRPGSGKSTTSKKIAEMLHYERFSSGDFLRALAEKRGITIEELNRIAESEKEIDHEIDEALRKLGESDSSLVIDSRLAFHWIPHSFKVYLNISREEAVRRIYSDKTELRLSTSDKLDSMEDALEHIEARLQSERKRYRELYDIDPYDPDLYDLVVDTDEDRAERVANIIVTEYKRWLED